MCAGIPDPNLSYRSFHLPVGGSAEAEAASGGCFNFRCEGKAKRKLKNLTLPLLFLGQEPG